MRKLTPKQWQTHLDELFRQAVRKRGYCERCGKKENLQTSHIFSRSNKEVRWDLENAFCLDSGCHIFWWHKNPIEAAEFTREKMGEENYELLRYRSRQTRQWSEADYKAIEEVLLKEIYGNKYNG